MQDPHTQALALLQSELATQDTEWARQRALLEELGANEELAASQVLVELEMLDELEALTKPPAPPLVPGQLRA